jgi:UDP-glucose 4-epimerase
VNALVTGGAGFVGSHLVDRLVARGDHVTVVDDLTTGRVENLAAVASQVSLRQADAAVLLRDEPELFTTADVIFHLAGNPYIPPSVEYPPFDYRLNLQLVFDLLETLRVAERGPRLVFASSAAVYGNPVRLPMHEADPTVPISPYGVSKLAAERYVAVYSELYGLPATSLRFFSVNGPRQHKQVVFDLLDRVARDPARLEVLGDGTQERDFAFVGDVADALLFVAEHAPGRGEALNVASGATHSISELVAAICATLDVTPEVRFTGSVRPGDAERWAVDLTALRALGFKPQTTLAEGLAATRDWYLAAHGA